MTTKKIILSFALIIVLAVLFVWLKPKKTEAPVQNNQAATSATPETRTYELIIADKKIVSGPSTLKAVQDDKIVMRVTADEDEEIHIHGLDISLDLEAGKQGTVIFTASDTGRFEFELEGSGTVLGTLEISPR